MISATNLSTTRAAGNTGHITDTASAHAAINALTGILSKGKITLTLDYTSAFALSTRPTSDTDVLFNVVGGTLTDPDPTWFINGDSRDIFPS